MHPADQALWAFLARARTVALRRRWLTTLADSLVWLAGAWLVCVWATAWTGRGDLAAMAWAASAAAVAGFLLFPALLATRRLRRSRLEIARLIARGPGPPAEADAQRVLRQEILGAAELADSDWQAEGRIGFRGSEALARRYVERLGNAARQLNIEDSLHRPNWRVRLVAGGGLLLLLVGLTWVPQYALGQSQFMAARDARPLPETGPLWTHLELELIYPEHVDRSPRKVSNLSGELRAPAGTGINALFDIPTHFEQPVLIIQPTGEDGSLAGDIERRPLELEADRRPATQPRPDGLATRSWQTDFILDTRMQWSLEVQGGPRRGLGIATISPPETIDLEADQLPEVELLGDHRPTSAQIDDRVELRVHASDDFGLTKAELVYQFEDGSEHRLPLGRPEQADSREWTLEYAWELEEIPFEQRREIIYWIEVWDDDPGLARGDAFEGIGKVGKSAIARLRVEDDESKHAENIARVVRIRDAAVDLLAARLTTRAFELPESEAGQRLLFNLRRVRLMHRMGEELLFMLVDLLDAIQFDPLTSERDAAIIEEIHARLVPLHREAAQNLAEISVGREDEILIEDPLAIPRVLTAGGVNNERQAEQLEDELIRLDDLVDGQLVERLEALVARLQSSQQRLVDLLEQLEAGDESVRARIEQLERRINEDMQRVNQARSHLSKELGHEFVNEDAYRAMEAKLKHQSISKRLAQGDVEGALDNARQSLDEIRELRNQVQDSAQGAQGEDARLSPEARARMKLLRELSRIEDDQRGIRDATKVAESSWRSKISDRTATDAKRRRLHDTARALERAASEINDARLGREARAAHHDLKRTAQRLVELTSPPEPGRDAATRPTIEVLDALRSMDAATDAASQGAALDETEGRQLSELHDQIVRQRRAVARELPKAQSVLEADEQRDLGHTGERQGATRSAAVGLLDDPAAAYLPEAGRRALERADEAMSGARRDLNEQRLMPALDQQVKALKAIEDAIASLREQSPPPPPPPRSSNGDASTATERDRSLREQVVEAMKERDRDALGDDVERYYEELLR